LVVVLVVAVVVAAAATTAAAEGLKVHQLLSPTYRTLQIS
jgi:hypothetical protein